jgi:hypothetical protein
MSYETGKLEEPNPNLCFKHERLEDWRGNLLCRKPKKRRPPGLTKTSPHGFISHVMYYLAFYPYFLTRQAAGAPAARP